MGSNPTEVTGQNLPPSEAGPSIEDPWDSAFVIDIDDRCLDHDEQEYDDPLEYIPNPDIWDHGPEDDRADDDPVVDGTIEIRHFEGGGWCRMHNRLLKEWGSMLGPYCIAVYIYLAMRADNTTQQARPSYKTIARETGMSRSKAMQSVRLLEAWGLIRCQARYHESGQRPNLFTLLGERHWRRKATFENGRGQIITKRLNDEGEEDSEDGVSPAIGPTRSPLQVPNRAEMSPPGPHGRPLSSPGEPPSRPGELGSKPRIPGLVHHNDPGGARGDHELDSHRKTHLGSDPANQTQYKKTTGANHAEPSGGRFLPPLRPGASEVSRRSDTTVSASNDDPISDQPLTSLQFTLLKLSSSRKLTDPMREWLSAPVICAQGRELPREYPSPEELWKAHPDMFNEYVQDCAKRYRLDFRRQPPLKDLIRYIRVYHRDRTGWLDFSEDKKFERDNARYPQSDRNKNLPPRSWQR